MGWAVFLLQKRAAGSLLTGFGMGKAIVRFRQRWLGAEGSFRKAILGNDKGKASTIWTPDDFEKRAIGAGIRKCPELTVSCPGPKIGPVKLSVPPYQTLSQVRRITRQKTDLAARARKRILRFIMQDALPLT